ncbi:hypothetical protein AB3M75_18940 [Serratia ureilytica]|uniref:hypothetical protein n=1 Tax=Serratia ureilytica TaxID=300181 RepID=UPI00371726B0
MSGWLQKLMQGGLLLLLLAAICLGGYSTLLSHQLVSARQQAAELQKSLAQQRQEQQLRQQHEAYQRKYREAIKNDPCAAQPLPGAVFELLRPAAGAAGRAAVAP